MSQYWVQNNYKSKHTWLKYQKFDNFFLLLKQQPFWTSLFLHSTFPDLLNIFFFEPVFFIHSSLILFWFFTNSAPILVDIHFPFFANLIPLPPKSHKECALVLSKHSSCHVGFENQNKRIFHHVMCSLSQPFPVPSNWRTTENELVRAITRGFI